MTEMAKGSVTHQRLIALLSQEGANFRVVTHEAVGKCEAVSEIRGTALGQGAKALVCKVKGNGVNQHVLAILAADQQADYALRWPARRKSMNSQAVSSARSPLSASIQNSNWLPTLYSSNDLMKSPSMQGCWINPLF